MKETDIKQESNQTLVQDKETNITQETKKEPLILTILRQTVNDIITNFNNTAKTNKYKVEYVLKYEKGKAIIHDVTTNQKTKSYYTLKLTIIDYTKNTIGDSIVLYNKNYPINIKQTSLQAETSAYKEFIFNSIALFIDYLVNKTYTEIANQEKDKDNIKEIEKDNPIIIDTKPKLII